jgi:[ribosomal protein S5]-alanine N-acetyltransferase
MDTSNITITTKNLCLKGISLDYKKDIFKEFTVEIAKHMSPKVPEKIEETIEFIEKSIKENKKGSNLQLVVLDKEYKDFLGLVALHHIDTKTPKLRVWLKKSAHGSGYGKEAIIALKDWADENLDFDYLIYPVADTNLASRRIPEFYGKKISREYDRVNKKGKKQHMLLFKIFPLKKLKK